MTATLNDIVASGTLVVVSGGGNGPSFMTSKTGNPTLPGESSVPSGHKHSGGNRAVGVEIGEKLSMGMVGVVGVVGGLILFVV